MGSYRTTKGEEPPAPPHERRRRRGVVITLSTVGGLAVLAAGLLIHVNRFCMAGGYVTTENYAEVRPSAAGVVAEILAGTGSAVTQGQVLVRLESGEERAAMEGARRQVLKMEAELARRRAEIAEERRGLQERIELARLRLAHAATKRQRSNELLERGLLAGSALEDVMLAERLAQAECDSLLKTDQGVHDKELAVLQAELEARREAHAQAEARLRAREIRAPVGGQAQRNEFVLGELVRPENVLYEIFGGERLVLKLRVPERYATRLQVGQTYRAKLTPYGGLQPVWFTGRIRFLRDVIQAEGQLTYRVAYGDFAPGVRPVPPGTSAEARVYYGRSNLWLFLFNLD